MTDAWHKIAFSEDLYLIPGTVKDKAPESKPLQYKGSNAKNVVVIVPGPLAEDDLTFLGNILNAVDHQMDDIALLSWNEDLKEDITGQLIPEKIICFGISQDPWTAGAAYEVVEKNSVKHLLADALPVISNDQNLKRKLWNSMKQLF